MLADGFGRPEALARGVAIGCSGDTGAAACGRLFGDTRGKFGAGALYGGLGWRACDWYCGGGV